MSADAAQVEVVGHSELLTVEAAIARIQGMTGQDGYWDVLSEVAATPIELFRADERAQAELFVRRVAFHALVQDRWVMPATYTEKQWQEAWDCLTDIASKAQRFHLLPEFEFYLSATTWRPHVQAQTLPHIAAAVNKSTLGFANFKYIRKILLSLRGRQHDFEAPLEDEVQAIVDQYDLVAMLRGAMALAERDARTSAKERALLAFFELDLEVRYGRFSHRSERLDATKSIRALPSPTPAEYWAAVADGDTPLTARSWAFLLDCSWLSKTEEACDLLARYPDELNHPLCDGIRAVLQSFFVDANKVDVYLAKGLHLLMEFEQRFFALGESVLLQADGRWVEVPLDLMGLALPEPYEYLGGIDACKPIGYPRVAEVCDLYSTLSLIYECSNASEDGKREYDGLPWLFEQSAAFHQAVPPVLRGRVKRWSTFLDSFTRCVKLGINRREYWYDPDAYADEGEEISDTEAAELMGQLSELIEISTQLSTDNEKQLNRAVAPIFKMVGTVESARPQLLALSRRYDPYLRGAGTDGLFIRGYLEQVASAPRVALTYYLLLIASDAKVDSNAVKNARLLWMHSNDEQELEALTQAIEDAFSSASNSAQLTLMHDLHREAKERLKALTSAAQFQRTAVNRWPKVTAPAMKVLSVLHQIKSFRGFDELASYAGMDSEWTRKHYNKLVELGMLLEKGTTYDINPYIVSYLERENQHAVVGRIIRTQGTSAVKQVFNSTREFTIYQVLVQLCPNHLVFPNSSLQSIMSFDRMKELVSDDDFGYYLRASVDIVVVSATSYLPLLAIEVDSVWHDTERQQRNDDKKDRLFATAGIPFMRLRPVGQPSQNVIRGQVAEHLDEMIRAVRADMPGYDQAINLLRDLSDTAR